MEYEEAKQAIAKKYNLGSTLVTGHKAAYFEEAAIVFAESKHDIDKLKEEFYSEHSNYTIFSLQKGVNCKSFGTDSVDIFDWIKNKITNK